MLSVLEILNVVTIVRLDLIARSFKVLDIAIILRRLEHALRRWNLINLDILCEKLNSVRVQSSSSSLRVNMSQRCRQSIRYDHVHLELIYNSSRARRKRSYSTRFRCYRQGKIMDFSFTKNYYTSSRRWKHAHGRLIWRDFALAATSPISLNLCS